MLLVNWIAIGFTAAVLFGMIAHEREAQEEKEQFIRELKEISFLLKPQCD